jgi:hypothetical protein
MGMESLDCDRTPPLSCRSHCYGKCQIRLEWGSGGLDPMTYASGALMDGAAPKLHPAMFISGRHPGPWQPYE